MYWNLYPNFSRDELKCRETGECVMHPDLMEILQSVRDEHAKPMFISSGYRSSKHSIEAMKDKSKFKPPGVHTLGMAVDIICYGTKAVDLTKLFFHHGIRRFGFHQKGNANARYIHVDIGDKNDARYPVSIWTY